MEPVWIIAAAAAAVLVVILLLRAMRGRERVIDSAPSETTGPEERAHAAGAAPDKAAAEGQTAGELLELQGKDDPECGLADWLMEDAERQLGGINLSSDRMAMTRLAEAALKASADLKATGRASVSLEYLYADAGGPRHYKRDVAQREAELGMIDHGALAAYELLQWRGRDEATVSLGEWLGYEADSDASGGSLDPASEQRLADAAEQAVIELRRSGRAVVELPGMTKDEGGTFNFRREVDRETLGDLLNEA